MIPENDDAPDFSFYEIYRLVFERRNAAHSIPGEMYVLGTCLEDAMDRFNAYADHRTISTWRGEVVVISSVGRLGDIEVMHTLETTAEDDAADRLHPSPARPAPKGSAVRSG